MSLEGWTIANETRTIYEFDGSLLGKERTVRVVTGQGLDRDEVVYMGYRRVGFVVVVAAAGPLGFIGYLFETTGLSLFLTNPRPILVMMLLGAAIIVVGT